MRTLLKLAAAMVALFAMTTSAIAQDCAPLPPKDLSGGVAAVGVVRQSIAATYFQQNGCNWNGNDGLNGTDAYVFDVTGIEGTASATAVAGKAGVQIAWEGIVLDNACKKIGNSLSIGSSTAELPIPYVIEVPAGAKWLVVQGSPASPVQTNVATQTQLSIHYEGKTCEQPVVVKKKKKKRRR